MAGMRIKDTDYILKRIARFHELVDKKELDKCWEWTGSLDKSGYGTYSLGGRTIRAHRFAYLLAYGALGDEQVVRHKCDNPKCCNPNHLESGTQFDNVMDMHSRGRAVPPPNLKSH